MDIVRHHDGRSSHRDRNAREEAELECSILCDISSYHSPPIITTSIACLRQCYAEPDKACKCRSLLPPSLPPRRPLRLTRPSEVRPFSRLRQLLVRRRSHVPSDFDEDSFHGEVAFPDTNARKPRKVDLGSMISLICTPASHGLDARSYLARPGIHTR